MSDSVAKPSGEIEAIRAASLPIRDLTRGGAHMRTRGRAYLPKFAAEDDEDYNARLASTWLFDGVGKTIEDMNSKVFAKPVTAESATDGDLSEDVTAWTENVDMEGRDLARFAKDVFHEAQRAGTSYIMADAPPRPAGLTRAQVAALNIRPYLVLLTVDDVLGWKWANIGNAPRLTQFRIAETVSEPDPKDEFAEVSVEQVRVLDLPHENGAVTGTVNVRIFRKTKVGNKENWTLFEEYGTDMQEIMVAPVDLGRTGFFMAEPVHLRLAEINLAHWRVQSDKANCLHKALAPLLFMKQLDVDADGDLVKSAGYGFLANSEAADMKYVEIAGQGIAAARDELKDLEFQMQAMGLQLLVSKTGNNTATGDAIDEGKQNSRLGMWADILQDALELAFSWMVDLAGLGEAVNIVVNKDFAADALSHLDMDALSKMHLSGVISARTYINEAKRRGVLSENVNPDDEEELVASGAMDQPIQ